MMAETTTAVLHDLDTAPPSLAPHAGTAQANEDANFETVVLEATREFIRPHDESRREDFVRILNEAHGQIPPEIDRPMLAILRNRLGGDLDYEQRARYREILPSNCVRRLRLSDTEGTAGKIRPRLVPVG